MNPNSRLKDPKKGWIMRQLDGHRPLSRYNFGEAPDGTIRIASRIDRIAGAIAGLDIKRMYRRAGDRRYFFFWSLKGDYSGVTLDQPNTLAEFLKATRCADYEMYLQASQPAIVRPMDVKLNAAQSTMYIMEEVEFEKEWTAPAEFREV